jgi:hypothetical protein
MDDRFFTINNSTTRCLGYLFHSDLNASIGLTFAARRAGSQQADKTMAAGTMVIAVKPGFLNNLAHTKIEVGRECVELFDHFPALGLRSVGDTVTLAGLRFDSRFGNEAWLHMRSGIMDEFLPRTC